MRLNRLRHARWHGPKDAGLQVPQHARVTQRVRLNALKVQELGHTFVIGEQEFLKDILFYGRTLNDIKTIALEEIDFKSQAEQAPYTQFTSDIGELLEELTTDSGSTHGDINS